MYFVSVVLLHSLILSQIAAELRHERAFQIWAKATLLQLKNVFVLVRTDLGVFGFSYGNLGSGCSLVGGEISGTGELERGIMYFKELGD